MLWRLRLRCFRHCRCTVFANAALAALIWGSAANASTAVSASIVEDVTLLASNAVASQRKGGDFQVLTVIEQPASSISAAASSTTSNNAVQQVQEVQEVHEVEERNEVEEVKEVLDSTQQKAESKTTVESSIDTLQSTPETHADNLQRPIKYWGNSFSGKFHRPSCPFAKSMNARHVVLFCFRRDAIASGQKPCRYCLPPFIKRVECKLLPRCQSAEPTSSASESQPSLAPK